MRIKTVSIHNFRTIYEATIDFYDVTTFVGPNGVGKSTVLYALDWFFNGERDHELTSQDATYGHEQEDIRVEVTFSELTEHDKEVLGKYSTPEVTEFIAWKTKKHQTGHEELSANSRGYALFSPLKEDGLKAAEVKSLYSKIREEHPELELKESNSKANILKIIRNWELKHPDKLGFVPESVSTSFKGFNSNAALADLFTFSLVRADFRANEQAEDGKNSLLSSIIERTIDRKSADDKLKQAFEDIQNKEKSIYDDVYNAPLSDLSKSLNEVVGHYTSNRDVSIQPNVREINPPKTTFSIRVNDGNFQTEVEKQGHGFQRTLLISTLQLLSEQSTKKSNGTLCLAIEEPELYQYPVQAKVFASVLRKLAEDKTKEFQVTYATHSKYFLEAQHFDQVYRLIRPNNSETYKTIFKHATMDEIKKKIGDYYNNNISSRLKKVYTNQLPIGIFSNAAILTEGSTDKAVLEHIPKEGGEVTLDKCGISVIACGSKTSIIMHHAILHALGIPTLIFFDNDSGWAKRSANKSEERKAQERENHKLENEKIRKYFCIPDDKMKNGFPVPGFYTGITKTNMYIVEDTLETFLAANWDGWCKEYEAAKVSLNIQSEKSSEVCAEATTNLMFDKCPKDIRQFIDKAIELC
uniref:Predicted ATP-dependent endonuclease, OLD family n=1 Tax=Loigolactobacillus rennini TaxID=238013 RepID=A0A1K2IBK3_9LACO|nr:predicted ATP-dependent endonuclease, OLD family [Loigolactobacillus rennini]